MRRHAIRDMTKRGLSPMLGGKTIDERDEHICVTHRGKPPAQIAEGHVLVLEVPRLQGRTHEPQDRAEHLQTPARLVNAVVLFRRPQRGQRTINLFLSDALDSIRYAFAAFQSIWHG